MLLSIRCKDDFTKKTQTRGAEYARQGRVTITDNVSGLIEARVEGSDQTYTVQLEFDSRHGEFEAACSCPHFCDGNLCKHIWATITHLDMTGQSGRFPGSEPIYVSLGEPVDEDNWSDDDWCDEQDEQEDEVFDFRSLIPPPLRGRANSPSRSPATPKGSDWRDKLAAIVDESQRCTPANWDNAPFADREVWFVLDLAETTSSNAPIISLMQRERRKDGEWGKLKNLTFYLSELSEFPDETDRELLQFLYVSRLPERSSSRYSYYGDDAFESIAVNPDFSVRVLRRLTASPRFRWVMRSDQDVLTEGRSLAADDGPAWTFRLRISPEPSRPAYRIDGEFYRLEETLPRERLVMFNSSGLLLLDDAIAEHDSLEHAGWISMIFQSGTLFVPHHEIGEFLQEMWNASSVPECILPPELRWETVTGQPQALLRVTGSVRTYRGDGLTGQICFRYVADAASVDSEAGSVRYAEREIPYTESTAGFVDEEQKRVLVRNRAAERELLASLAGLPIARRGSEWDYRTKKAVETHFAFEGKNLPLITRTLSDAGWIVEIDGRAIRSPGAAKMNVTSSVDWFELDAQIDFDGVSASLPDLLKAVRSGERFVRLDDGTQGLLPEEWLAKYTRYAELGEAVDGKVRFRNSQALLLDALLASQDAVTFDRQFDTFRKKLKSFSGVAPSQEPRGFQGELREYQRHGLGWMRFLQEFRLGGCLADDMGLGKTVQVLALLQSRKVRGNKQTEPHLPSLVVVPKSLVFNWIDEAARFAPNLNVLNYTGTGRQSALPTLGEYDAIVTTYGSLRMDAGELKDVEFDYVILDESQAIKNAETQASKACRLLKARHRLAMTGTPIENHLGELWALFEFLNPGMLGRAAAFQAAAKRTGNGSDNGTLQTLARGIAPFLLRRTKEQVLKELPEKTEQTLHCDLTGKQKKQYEQLRDYYRAQLSERIRTEGIKKSKIHVLEALLRLRQAACHPGMIDKAHARMPSAKIDLLLEQLDEVLEEGHKTLVFSQFTTFLDLVKKKLDKKNIPYEYLDGQTSNRKKPVERFQNDPDCKLFLISLKAGGHGLNLTAAEYVYILDPWWNPAVEAQAIDRAHRIGQTKPVFAYRIIARGTVEEKIVELQKSKRALADAVITANESLIQSLTADDLQLLLS
jgi:superfamily II DNA or RNA helicase